MQYRPTATVDGARILAVQRHHVAPPAVRILGVEVRQRLPAATETYDLDIILAAAVGDGFDDRVEAGTSPPPVRMPMRFFTIAPLNWTFANLFKPARHHSGEFRARVVFPYVRSWHLM